MAKAKARREEIAKSLLDAMHKVDRIAAYLSGAAATCKVHESWETEDDLLYTVYLINAAEETLGQVRDICDRASTSA